MSENHFHWTLKQVPEQRPSFLYQNLPGPVGQATAQPTAAKGKQKGCFIAWTKTLLPGRRRAEIWPYPLLIINFTFLAYICHLTACIAKCSLPLNQCQTSEKNISSLYPHLLFFFLIIDLSSWRKYHATNTQHIHQHSHLSRRLSITAIKEKVNPCWKFILEEFSTEGKRAVSAHNNRKPIQKGEKSRTGPSLRTRALWFNSFQKQQGIYCFKLLSVCSYGSLIHMLSWAKVKPVPREGSSSLEIGQLCCRVNE